MDLTQSQLARRCVAESTAFAVITIEAAQGSTPREAGAAMVVTESAIAGTIGGGRLEWDAVAAAKGMLKQNMPYAESKMRAMPSPLVMDVPLGPEIGQCCGGRVRLVITLGDARVAEALAAAERSAIAVRPAVFIYGAGHVGRALALALAPVPFRVVLADVRAEELERFADARVENVLAGSLTDLAANAPDGAAHAVMTHSHALDSLIAAAVLETGRHRYLGLIGSKTKKTLFFKGFRELGVPEDKLSAISCPIGGAAVRDKRPAVIAALAAAEIVTALLKGAADQP